MKKIMVTGLAIALAVAVVSGALAFGPGTGMGMGMMGGSLTPEQARKAAQFQKDITPLREKMFKLMTEVMELRATEKPDWKAIADKQKAMVDIRTEIDKKATEAGVAGMMGPGSCGCGTGTMGMGAMGKGRMGMGRMSM